MAVERGGENKKKKENDIRMDAPSKDHYNIQPNLYNMKETKNEPIYRHIHVCSEMRRIISSSAIDLLLHCLESENHDAGAAFSVPVAEEMTGHGFLIAS